MSIINIYIDNLLIYIKFWVHFWYKTDIFHLISIIFIVSTDFHLSFWSLIQQMALYWWTDTINLSTFFDKFIVLVCRYKGVSPCRGKNDTEKMVDMVNRSNIRQQFTLLHHFYHLFWYKTIKRALFIISFIESYQFYCFRCYLPYCFYRPSINH